MSINIIPGARGGVSATRLRGGGARVSCPRSLSDGGRGSDVLSGQTEELLLVLVTSPLRPLVQPGECEAR